MKRSTVINNLTEGPLGRQMILFSLPLVLGNLLHTLYNLVDMAVVGQFVGSAGLSAVATAGQITMLLYCLGIGLGSGSQILVAQQVGADEKDAIRVTIGTSFSFTVILALFVTALGVFFNRPILRLLNTPAEAMTDAMEYMFWCCLGIPFTYLNGGLSALLRGMGDSKHPTCFVAAAAVTNVILDFVFVAGLGWRAKGAAIATALAQLVGAVYCIGYLYKNREAVGFDFQPASFRMDKRTLWVIVKLSAPLAFQTIAINISMLFVNAWVNAYGVVASAVHGIGSKLYSLTTIVTNAMQTAVATFTGQNIAAGRPDRVKRSLSVSVSCCLAFWIFAALACILCPRAVFAAFTQEPDVLAMAPRYMRIQIVMYLSFALMSTPIGFINGIGHVTLNFVIALLDGVVARIGLGLLLAHSFGLGLYGYWWGSALAGFVSVIWGWLYFFSGRWKTRKLLV